MSQGSNHLFNKYLDSSITDDERFELEKRALDDEFVSDAMEGVELYQQSDKKNIGLWMQQVQLHSKSGAKMVSMFSKNMYRYAAAASLAVVIAAFLILRPDNKESVRDSMAIESSEVIDNVALKTETNNIVESSPTDEPPIIEDQQKEVAIPPSKRKAIVVETKTTPEPIEQNIVSRSESDITTADEAKPEIRFNGKLKSNNESQSTFTRSDESTQPAIRKSNDFDAVSLSRSEKTIAEKQPVPIAANSTRALSGRGLKKQVVSVNRNEVYPLIGYEELDKRASNIRIEKTFAFMRNMQFPYTVNVEFLILENGTIEITQPSSITATHVDSAERKAMELIIQSGKWKSPRPNFRTTYDVVIRGTK